MSAKPFVFDTDVLIIGGGFSGSWAALTARQHVENVLIVDKGPRDWGGLGGMSGGDMIVKQPEFAAKDLVEELVYYYDGLCEQDVLEEILNQSYERFKDYEKMGHEFARDDSGRLMSIPQRGLELMRYYFYHPYGKGGAHTTQILNAELQRLNVQRIGRIEITDLVKDGDAVSGAVGFHAQSGTPVPGQGRHPRRPQRRLEGLVPAEHLRGRRRALAYGAGASCATWSSSKTGTCPSCSRGRADRDAPHGARFLNGEGEDFMRRYSRSWSQGRPALQRARHGL
ncbi:MAG: FAD-binding protein [Bilophila wadsworthia]